MSSPFALTHLGFVRRCFLALKHGSEAMMKTNPSRGKELSGGSIIMTASGKLPPLAEVRSVHTSTRSSSRRVAFRSRDSRL